MGSCGVLPDDCNDSCEAIKKRIMTSEGAVHEKRSFFVDFRAKENNSVADVPSVFFFLLSLLTNVEGGCFKAKRNSVR